ncbi:hypothetical protein FQN55_001019 [Onygenales sp. PD_40]|nr:hypothetical protein FQN55_001019 [Onygenales sp. PD_40]KAK2774126.1 hypothetical protein FQN53_003751 [Emmonsiellopsis sp. PD_33]KAK2792139.1 hypothetical protein FQN52_003907 [Onygenales sp. PD_12]KAK2798248.1 hypothetical protein FQN51_007814 [Onygenales sp. PD_10]
MSEMAEHTPYNPEGDTSKVSGIHVFCIEGKDAYWYLSLELDETDKTQEKEMVKIELQRPDGGTGECAIKWTPLNIERDLGPSLDPSRYLHGSAPAIRQVTVDNIHSLISALNRDDYLIGVRNRCFCEWVGTVINDMVDFDIIELTDEETIGVLRPSYRKQRIRNGQSRQEHPPGFKPKPAEVKSDHLKENAVYLSIPGFPGKKIHFSCCSRAEPESETKELGNGVFLVNFRHNIYFKIPDEYLEQDDWKERIGWDSLPVVQLSESKDRSSYGYVDLTWG